MANYTIEERPGKGGIRYRCLVRGIGSKSKSRTFGRREAAAEWGKTMISGKVADEGNLRTIIRLYLDEAEIGRSKRYALNMICDCDLALVPFSELSAKDIVDFCKSRRDAGAGPATVNHDISYLRSVLKMAKPVWGYRVDDTPIKDAMYSLKALKLIAKSRRRTRRPVDEELEKLKEGLLARGEHANSNIPFAEILDFSILTCMRVGEVCKILWEDVDYDKRSVMVRNRKDPRKKEGNNMLVPMLGGAWEILLSQPKTDERIFPYNSRTITAGFQRVRNRLGIKDLRYHDMRREGVSRLFEKGYAIEQVAQVSGHRDLNILFNVYTELNPKRLHDFQPNP